MKIGIDIDDTIASTNKKIIEEAEYYDREYLNNRGFKNKNAVHFMEMFYWNVLDVDSFFKYLKNSSFFLNLDMIEDANKYINKLYDEGNEIIFITRRRKSIKLLMNTKKWLKKNDIKYSKLYLGIKDKGLLCKDLNIDIFIDNDSNNIEEASKYGIDALLMTDRYNKRIRKCNRVNNWKEVYDYIKKVK